MLLEFFTIFFVLIFCTLAGTAVVAWHHVDSPAVDLFAVVAGVLGTGSLVIAVGYLFSNAAFVLGSTISVAMILPIPWILFAFDYIGQEDLISLSSVGALATPLVLGLSATLTIFVSRLFPGFTLFVEKGTSGLTAVVVAAVELTQWGGMLYAGGVILAGTGLVLRSFQRYAHLDSTTGTVLCTFGVIPWISVLFALQLQSVSFAVFSGTVAVGFGTGAIAAAALVGPSSLFDRVPAAGNVGPTTVIEELDDAVVITDGEGQVIELNPSARQLFGPQQDTFGTQVSTLLGSSLTDLDSQAPVEIESDSRRHLFDPTVSELTDQHGHLLGYAVVLRDATETTIRKQRLEVHNRVLRHNFRNDMTVLLGRLDVIRSQIDDPSMSDNLDTIDRTGQELVALADEIRELERLLSADIETAQPIQIKSIARQIFDRTEAERDAKLQYRGETVISLAATPDQLQAALEKLIVNGIKHNNSDTPEVQVRVTHRSGTGYPLEIAVLDNGPGIPEAERKTISTGEETPLSHSVGVGLWSVHWITRSLGGKMSIENRDPTGTAVKLLIPTASIEANASDESTPTETVEQSR